ncbi:MAG: class I adenylate-forming enzyme family protein [Acidimicrobiia bacterium]
MGDAYSARSLLEGFIDNARRDRSAPLVRYFDCTLSIGDVDDLSDALACGLAAAGFARGDRIAIYLQNVPQYLIALLAVWKAGGIAVAVNPMYRQREVQHLLTDSGAVGIVALESLYADVVTDVLREVDIPIVITTSELDLVTDPTAHAVLAGSSRIDVDDTIDLLSLVERHRGQRPALTLPEPDDVACLVYTSGTTGPAKGAMNTHGALAFSAGVYRRCLEVTPDDVVLAVAPLFHITGLTAHIAISVMDAIPMVLMYRFDPALVLEMIERHRATFTVASITVFQALMDHPESRSRDLSSMRCAYSGGQAVAPATVDAYRAHMGLYIRVAYGLTETTGPTHMVPLDGPNRIDPATGAMSVGRTGIGLTCRIVDEAGGEVPVGAIGEVVVQGDQIVPGYWRKEAETANAMRNGWFHTGDVGYVDADGWLFLVDRKKDQINAGGYKIWPREVEDVLYEHSAVREAAVVGVPDTYRGETVKAFVSLRRGAEASVEELIAHCRERLAAFKAPRQIEILDDLPKTASGKILRRSLR